MRKLGIRDGLRVRQNPGNGGGNNNNNHGQQGGQKDPLFSNVVLLMGYEGADGATTYVDESIANHSFVNVGTAQIDTAQFKFGSSSLLIAAAGDTIRSTDSNDWDLSDANSDQFTVEAWIRFNGTAGTQAIASQWGRISQRAWCFRFNSGTGLGFLTSTAGSAITNTIEGAWSPSTGTWYHVATDKDATGKVRLYVGGAMVGSSTPADSTIFASSQDLRVGSIEDAVTGNVIWSFDGWIDEIRITKGAARYASDAGYTVPNKAFPRR